MKVFFDPRYYEVYTSDPAAEPGRMEAVVKALDGHVQWIEPEPAAEKDIAACHASHHIEDVRRQGLYDIAALAAGGAVAAAEQGMAEPAFALVRPPGHHASRSSSWGFCWFNNMAIAVTRLLVSGRAKSAFILDFDMHFGDGTVDILGKNPNVTIFNPGSHDRLAYRKSVYEALTASDAEVFAISAGFDNHIQDWGGLLITDDYFEMGREARAAARLNGAGLFAVLEGGYNHKVLGKNALSLIQGMSE